VHRKKHPLRIRHRCSFSTSRRPDLPRANLGLRTSVINSTFFTGRFS
jgi:hypothetical protein